MPKTKYSELTAGLFVILGLAVTLAVVLWLGAAELFGPTGQEAFFSVELKDGSKGLEIGGYIKINDKVIGKITDIRLAAGAAHTLYVARIEQPDIKIHADGKATIATGLVGSATLVITSLGDPNEPLTSEQDPIEITGGLATAMSDLAGAAGALRDVAEAVKAELDTTSDSALLVRIHEIMAKIDAAVDEVVKITKNIRGETNREQSDSLMKKVHDVVDNVGEIAADAKPKIEKTLTAAAKTAEKIEAYADEDLGEILADFRKAGTKIVEISNNLRDVSAEAKDALMLNRSKIDEIIENIAIVTANLKATSENVRRRPWLLLHKPKPGELENQNLYDAARAFVAGSEKLNQAAGKLKGLAAARPEGIAATDPVLIEIRKQIEETFESFSTAEQALWKELTK